jgi:hypothetical protein
MGYKRGQEAISVIVHALAGCALFFAILAAIIVLVDKSRAKAGGQYSPKRRIV